MAPAALMAAGRRKSDSGFGGGNAMDLGLRGKRAIVTGATKGMGRGVIELLLAEGAGVGFCAGTRDEVAEKVEPLQRPGTTVVGEAVNVRDGEAYKTWLERTAAALGGCDIFI